MQALLAVVLVLPTFLLFATRRPEPNLLTLGLPFEIIDFNLSSVLLAVALGGLPLMVAGIVFSHLAVPVLMRRRVPLPTLVGTALGGWVLGLLFVLIGYGALVGLLRINALDRLSSMYVGAATLQLLLGDYSLLLTAVIGTLVVAVAWTALLRIQARGWARLRRSSVGPRQMEEGRRWAALRQLGLLVAGAGALAAALLAAYQFGTLPNGDVQARLPYGAFIGLLSTFAAMAFCGGAACLAGRTPPAGDHSRPPVGLLRLRGAADPGDSLRARRLVRDAPGGHRLGQRGGYAGEPGELQPDNQAVPRSGHGLLSARRAPPG